MHSKKKKIKLLLEEFFVVVLIEFVHCEEKNLRIQITMTEYSLPQKKVKVPGDMVQWQRSKAFYDIIGFINGISVVVQGKKTTDPKIYISETMKNLIGVLDKLEVLLEEIPPVDQPQRFGNQAFRTWYGEVREVSIRSLSFTADKSNVKVYVKGRSEGRRPMAIRFKANILGS